MRRVIFREDRSGSAPYEVWDADSGILLHSYATEAARRVAVHMRPIWDKWRVVDE